MDRLTGSPGRRKNGGCLPAGLLPEPPAAEKGWNHMLQSTLCYLERGDEYLMLHRVKKAQDANHDKWIGIGGKFEDRESPEDCLLRECREETGLTLTEYRYRGLVTFVNTQWPTEYMHLFTATGWTGQAHPCDEGDLAWIRKKDLLALPMWEGDRISCGCWIRTRHFSP